MSLGVGTEREAVPDELRLVHVVDRLELRLSCQVGKKGSVGAKGECELKRAHLLLHEPLTEKRYIRRMIFETLLADLARRRLARLPSRENPLQDSNGLRAGE